MKIYSTRIFSTFLVAAGLATGQSAIAQTKSTRAAHKPAALAGPTALDKKQFEFYVRHLFVWPDAISVQISDPKPAPLAGFYEVDVRGSQGNASQDEKFFVSRNGRQIVRGTVYKFTDNPFRDELSKVKTEGAPSLGTAGAPVVIAEFSDFQCHFCKEEAKVLRENLIKQFPTQVHFFYIDYPLEALHPWARAGAIAGRCVYHQKEAAFWDFHDWIFEHQEQITLANLQDKVLEWAKSAALDTDKLGTCMATKATEKEVNASLEMGHALGIGSTPSTFINGRPLVGATPWPDVKAVIDFEIGYQETAHDAGENCGCDLGIRKLGVK